MIIFLFSKIKHLRLGVTRTPIIFSSGYLPGYRPDLFGFDFGIPKINFVTTRIYVNFFLVNKSQKILLGIQKISQFTRSE